MDCMAAEIFRFLTQPLSLCGAEFGGLLERGFRQELLLFQFAKGNKEGALAGVSDATGRDRLQSRSKGALHIIAGMAPRDY